MDPLCQCRKAQLLGRPQAPYSRANRPITIQQVVISMFYTPNQYIGAKGDFAKEEDLADLDAIRLIEIIVKIFER